MIISRLDLKAFGRFTDVSIDLSLPSNGSGRQRRFHLIYGPNESGKSTTLRAFTALLFGIPHITEDNYLHANAQMRVGGLLVDDSGRSLECVRRRGRKATLRDGNDDKPVDETQLDDMLGGINRETFLTRFGLSHDELVAGGAAIVNGEGDLGQILFAAGAGVGRLREIQDALDGQSAGLFTPRGSKTVINSALRGLDETRKELRNAQIAPAQFSGLRQRIDQKQVESNELDEQLQECVITLARLRSYQQALPLLPQWRSIIESLAKTTSTPTLDEAFIERRRQAMSDREVAVSRRLEFENRIAELSSRLEKIPVDSIVMNHESEIQALFQEVAARDKADRDRMDLIRVQKNADRKIIDLLRELSVEVSRDEHAEQAELIESSVERFRISESLRTRIRELASGYERLIGRRNDASDAIETAKRRLADATEELESMAHSGEPSLLTSAIEAVGNPQSVLDNIAQQQESCDALQRRCEDLLRRLDGFTGSIDEAVRLTPPSESIMKRHADDLRTTYQNLLSCGDSTGQIQLELEDVQREICDQESDEPLPTVEKLAEARQRRDRATDRIADLVRGDASQSETDRSIEELRDSIRLTDRIADTMRAHHEQVHRRESLVGRAVGLEARLKSARSTESKANDAFELAKRRWLDLWEACGVDADQPDRMQRWVADHEQLVQTVQSLRDEQKRLEQAEERAGRAASRLRSVMANAGSRTSVTVTAALQGELFDQPPDDDLITLYDEAVALRGKWTRSAQHRDAVLRRRDELSEELPTLETQFEAAQTAVEQWRDDWRRTTESFVSSDRAGTREVLQMLDQIGELTSKKRERDILATRIRSIGEDEITYASRVNRLASATCESVQADQPPTAIAQTIYQRLQAERTAHRSRETLREQLETAKQRLSEITAQQSHCDIILQQLCNEAGCESADELPAIERAARERHELQAELRDLENQLSILAGDQPIESFVRAAEKQQPALLEVEIDKTEACRGERSERLAQVQQDIGALRHELQLMDGSSRASELVQTIQMSAGTLSRDIDHFARLKVASLLLRRAIDHYQKANQSPVLARANQFFSQLTCGEYQELKPDYDAKGKTTLFGIKTDGASVPITAMSTGTTDALYFALRLASLQHQTSHGKAIPLIIDDCLVQLDDDRVIAALQSLSQLSETTQVILLTHHRHLESLAQRHLGTDDYHVHHLN